MWSGCSIMIRVKLGPRVSSRLRGVVVRRCSPAVLDRRGLRLRWSTPVIRLLCVLCHTDSGCSCRCSSRRCSPPTVAGRGGGVADTIGGWSSPLVHNWSIANTVRIVSRLSSLDLNLLVLNVDIVFRHGLIHCRVRLKTEKTKATSFLLLLIVHDDNFGDTAVPTKIVSQICFGYAGGKTAKENFGPVDVLLGFLHGSRVTRLGINCSSI